MASRRSRGQLVRVARRSITETVFSYPGIGTLSYESVRYKVYYQLMVLCILSGIIVILCNMLAQAMNEQIDPRIRAKQKTEESEVVRR